MMNSSSISDSERRHGEQTECEKWGDLTDRVATGDSLTDHQWLFVRAHARKCPSCGAEAELYAELRSLLHGQSFVADEPLRSLEPSAPEVVQSTPLGSPVPLRRRVSMVVTGAAAAVAALVLWGVPEKVDQSSSSPKSASGIVASPIDLPMAIALAAGDVRIGELPIAAGSTLNLGDTLQVTRGRACVDQEQGTTSCLHENSVLVVEESSTAMQRIRLKKGTIVCQLEENRNGKFIVTTGRVTVTATGTVFSVETDESSVNVRLHRGSVTVRAADSGEVRKMTAPSVLAFDGGWKELAWDESVAARDRALVEPARLWAKKPLGALTVDGIGEAGTIALDTIGLGPPPVSILTSPGPHSLLVESTEHVPYQHEVKVAEQGTVIRPSLELATGREATAFSAPKSSAAKEALTRAQTLRSAGRLLDAAEEYRSLIAQYASAPEARAALLSLGHLELKSFGRPAAALGHFERYLDGGGQLSQEASFGRIQALRQLGRRAEAERAIFTFLQDYPDSVQAESLRHSGEKKP